MKKISRKQFLNLAGASALALGLTVKQVENRLYRSKQKLRTWMSQ